LFSPREASFLKELWLLEVWPETNSPFWSLGYEAAYYVLFGIAFYERRKWNRLAWLLLFALLIGPKVLVLLPIWLLGAFPWHLYKRLPIPLWGGAVLCAGAMAIYVVFVVTSAGNNLNLEAERWIGNLPTGLTGMSKYFPSAYVSGILFAAIILGFKGCEHIFEGGVFPKSLASSIRLLAACTFSMYLYHYPLIYFFRATASVALGQESLVARSWWITIIVLFGTAASIYALARLTEQRKGHVRKLLTMALQSVKPTVSAH
jgi:peptidoglycan/LPS O-acetylase OafA/YrhL